MCSSDDEHREVFSHIPYVKIDNYQNESVKKEIKYDSNGRDARQANTNKREYKYKQNGRNTDF